MLHFPDISEGIDIHNCDIYSLAPNNPLEGLNLALEKEDLEPLAGRLKVLMNQPSAHFTQEQLFKIGAIVLSVGYFDR